MDKIFDLYFKYILMVEGGYTNDKHDKGGETIWGITKERARECGYTGSMRNLSQEKAKEIYYDKYYTNNLSFFYSPSMLIYAANLHKYNNLSMPHFFLLLRLHNTQQTKKGTNVSRHSYP